jgi:rubrerythrin
VFEQTVADLYAALAERHAADHEAARVFHRLAMEEDAHVRLIEYLRRLARHNGDEFGEVQIDLAAVEEATRRVLSFHRSVGPHDLEEAVKFAISLEASAAEVHDRSALAQANPQISDLLANLGRGDQDHADSLRRFAAARSILAAEETART